MRKLLLIACSLLFTCCAYEYEGKQYTCSDFIYLQNITDGVRVDVNTDVLYWCGSGATLPIVKADGTCLTLTEWKSQKSGIGRNKMKEDLTERLRKESTYTAQWELTQMIDRPSFVNGYVTGAMPREEKLDYAKAIIRALLDNSDEYARQRALDFLKEAEK